MGCSCQHLDCWSTTCADFLNTTNCCANTPHSYNTLPHFFLESFSQTWKHSACSFLYAFASQPYGDETTALIWTVYQWVEATEPGSSMRGGGGRSADQVQGNLVSLDNQSPAAKRKLPVAKRKAWCDNFFCKWTGSPVDLLALFISQKTIK